jgi:hypothetical protein
VFYKRDNPLQTPVLLFKYSKIPGKYKMEIVKLKAKVGWAGLRKVIFKNIYLLFL